MKVLGRLPTAAECEAQQSYLQNKEIPESYLCESLGDQSKSINPWIEMLDVAHADNLMKRFARQRAEAEKDPEY